MALATAVGGHGRPVNVAGSPAVGWGAAAVIGLVFGSPLGLPSTDEARLLPRGLGISAGPGLDHPGVDASTGLPVSREADERAGCWAEQRSVRADVFDFPERKVASRV